MLDYTKRAENYDKRWLHYCLPSFFKTLQILDLKEDSSLLDVGCGTGIFLEILEKKFPLTKAWAFKCNNQMKGIKIHADFAAINVNFWITPDKANLNKNTGGLLIWDKEAPKNWNFEKYNNNHFRSWLSFLY